MGYDSNDRYDGTLARCKFCGSDEASVMIYSVPFVRRQYYYVRCGECGAMTSPTAEYPEEAIEAWNRNADVDLVDVVRCSNCRHWERKGPIGGELYLGLCKLNKRNRDNTYFCADGKRKDGGRADA